MKTKPSIYSILQSKLQLSDSEVYVLGYIHENIDLAKKLSVRDIAANCFCSTTVIMNLSKKLGYNGYKEMVLLIEDELNGNNNIHSKNEIYLSEFASYSQDLAQQFVQLLLKHQNEVIYISGSGFCKPIVNYIQEKLMVLGFKTFDTWHVENYLSPMSNKPLFIAISKSGETKYILELAQIARDNDIDVISFTHQKDNNLRHLSTLNFSLYDCAVLDERNMISNSFYPVVLLLFEQLLAEYFKNEINRDKI